MNIHDTCFVFPDHILVDTWGTLLDHKNPARDAILRIKLPVESPPLERARSLVMICLMSAKMSSTLEIATLWTLL